jgi:hypothetical protein
MMLMIKRKFCLENGYVESEIKGLFKTKNEHWFNDGYSLSIDEYEMNVSFNDV